MKVDPTLAHIQECHGKPSLVIFSVPGATFIVSLTIPWLFSQVKIPCQCLVFQVRDTLFTLTPCFRKCGLKPLKLGAL